MWLIARIPLLPLISSKFQGIRWNLGEFRDIREIWKFTSIQWNSMGFCMALNVNSVGIPGKFRGNARFSGEFGVWGGLGRFRASKGFCANSQSDLNPFP